MLKTRNISKGSLYLSAGGRVIQACVCVIHLKGKEGIGTVLPADTLNLFPRQRRRQATDIGRLELKVTQKLHFIEPVVCLKFVGDTLYCLTGSDNIEVSPLERE